MYNDQSVEIVTYTALVINKANSLLMDEESMAFYNYHLNIVPKCHHLAVAYVQSILQILARSVPQATTLIRLLRTENPREQKKPREIVREIEKSVNDSNITELAKAKWLSKIARYLAYCLDGGLLHSKFTLKTFITLLRDSNINHEEEDIFSEQLSFLLHLRQRDQKWRLGDKRLFSDLHQICQDGVGDYQFNPKVMCGLIETGWVQKVLWTVQERDPTPLLIQQMFVPWVPQSIKEACCR